MTGSRPGQTSRGANQNVRLLAGLAAVGFLLAACSGIQSDLSRDGELDEEYRLKKAYEDCLKRSAKEGIDCTRQKNELLQEQEWNAMDGGV